MISVSDAVPLILPYAPGVPEPLIEDAIRTTAEDICRRARAWRHEDDFQMAAGDDVLAAPPAAHILEILTLTANDIPLFPMTERLLDGQVPGWRGKTGVPVYFWQRRENEIRLTPVPEEPVDLSFTMLLTTTVESEFLPETFRVSHRRLLIDGVVAELLSMPAKTWTNMEGAMVRGQRYAAGIDAANMLSQRGQQGARFRTKAQFL